MVVCSTSDCEICHHAACVGLNEHTMTALGDDPWYCAAHLKTSQKHIAVRQAVTAYLMTSKQIDLGETSELLIDGLRRTSELPTGTVAIKPCTESWVSERLNACGVANYWVVATNLILGLLPNLEKAVGRSSSRRRRQV